MIEVYTINCKELVIDENIKCYYNLISKETRIRISKFHFKNDVKRTLLGELLIRYILCTKYEMQNFEITLERDEYGKPYIKNNDSIYFNISHSSDWVVCAISNCRIGIDIERVENEGLDIAKNLFCWNEYQNIMKQEECSQKIKVFYKYWTLKESYVKYLGKGLQISLDSFEIEENKGVYRISNNDEIRLLSMEYKNNYMIGITTISKNVLFEIKELKLSELINPLMIKYESFVN